MGQPLCPDCYDYASAVVWQWWAPELWRRFTITLRRMLAHHLHVPPAHLGQVASVQYAKVAEYQLRGAVHFHALVRLDGPQTPDGFAPAPTAVTAPVLSALVEQAARAVRVTADPVHPGDVARVLAFGTQVDTRPVRTSSAPTTPTENSPPDRWPGTWPSTPPSPPPTPKPRTAPTCAACTPPPATCPPAPSAPTRTRPPRTGCSANGRTRSGSAVTSPPSPAATPSPSAPCAGPGSAPKPGSPKPTAPAPPSTCAPLEAELLADDADQTTVVIGSWAYAGTGWANDGETALATAAASRAREYAQERAQSRKQQSSGEK